MLDHLYGKYRMFLPATVPTQDGRADANQTLYMDGCRDVVSYIYLTLQQVPQDDVEPSNNKPQVKK